MKLRIHDLEVPVTHRFFEDYRPGSEWTYGPITMRESDILDFAVRYDPQPIHTDPRAAAAGPFGGLIASGWHTIAVVMRVLVENYLSHVAALVSPGVDELRWLEPVRPGDVLYVHVTILETTPSRSKPDRGLIRSSVETLNQRDQVVMSFKAMNLMRRRPHGAATRGGG